MNNKRRSIKNNIAGMKFGELEVIERTNTKRYNSYVWVCKCSCGNFVNTTRTNLIKGDITRCSDCAEKVRSESGNNLFFNHMSKYIIKGTNIKMIQSKILGTRNKSGVKGVCWDKYKNRWEATMGFQGKRIRLGRFRTIEEAKKARKEAEKKYFKPFIDNFYNKDF